MSPASAFISGATLSVDGAHGLYGISLPWKVPGMYSYYTFGGISLYFSSLCYPHINSNEWFNIWYNNCISSIYDKYTFTKSTKYIFLNGYKCISLNTKDAKLINGMYF